MTEQPDNTTMVRIKSHRAYDRVKRIVGEPDNFFFWARRGTLGAVHVTAIPNDKLDEVLAVKSVNRARMPADVELHRPFR